jgi:hypothetical protein
MKDCLAVKNWTVFLLNKLYPNIELNIIGQQNNSKKKWIKVEL